MAFLAWLLGGIGMWGYYTTTLDQPAPIAIALVAGSAVVFAALVAATRASLLHGRYTAATLVLPAGWVALEYTVSKTTPFGAWWSIAYTQADAGALLQLVAVTGQWGLTFFVLAVPAAIAVVTAPGALGRTRLRIGAAALVAAALTVGYGTWQIAVAAPSDGPRVRAAALAVAQPPESVPVHTPAGRDMLQRLVDEVRRLADGGARVVVLPEKSLAADELTLPLLTEPLGHLARERGIDIMAGLVLTRNGESVNAAIDLPSGTTYAKHHLVPDLEDELRPGDERVLVPGQPWALAIFFDLELPALVRAYRNDGAQLLLVPALDFGQDAWLHSRMAVTRGVESGVGVVRAAQLGALTVSDAHGEVIAEERADVTATAAIVADVPTDSAPTLYARFGDWFAWGCVALLVTLALLGVGQRRARRGIGPNRPERKSR